MFGNSHAIAGLRPAMVAEAFHLKPDEAFSFALPGASPREMRLLADRYLDRFPRAEAALCGVDEYFLSANIDTQLRYMTRFDPLERWRYAGRFASFDTRKGVSSWRLRSRVALMLKLCVNVLFQFRLMFCARRRRAPRETRNARDGEYPSS